jgi:hypothetical protein
MILANNFASLCDAFKSREKCIVEGVIMTDNGKTYQGTGSGVCGIVTGLMLGADNYVRVYMYEDITNRNFEIWVYTCNM